MEEAFAPRQGAGPSAAAMTPTLYPLPPASPGRARWLTALAEALANCDQLVATLIADGRHGAEVAALQARVIAIRSEVEALRRGLPPAISELDGEWLELLRPLYQTPSGKSPPPEKGSK